MASATRSFVDVGEFAQQITVKFGEDIVDLLIFTSPHVYLINEFVDVHQAVLAVRGWRRDQPWSKQLSTQKSMMTT